MITFIQKNIRQFMTTSKEELLSIVNGLPETIDMEEFMYQLYLREKLDAAEKDVQAGRLISDEQMGKEVEGWFASRGQ
ncbi:MAG: hypothetical protein HYZ34_01425 [Ignavibacteriae bacterium]|nr:hypothetical protein [Ignavibacteriota bacterium]